MKLETLQAEWRRDSEVDTRKLDEESARCSRLHSKYYDWYLAERVELLNLRGEYKKLRLAKRKFFTEGPTKEQHEQGWRLPARGKILKTEVDPYLEADDDLIALNIRVETQSDKVDFIYNVVNNIDRRRGYQLRLIFDFMKWQAGG